MDPMGIVLTWLPYLSVQSVLKLVPGSGTQLDLVPFCSYKVGPYAIVINGYSVNRFHWGCFTLFLVE